MSKPFHLEGTLMIGSGMSEMKVDFLRCIGTVGTADRFCRPPPPCWGSENNPSASPGCSVPLSDCPADGSGSGA